MTINVIIVFSKLKLTTGSLDLDQISIDRKNNNKGHCFSNIVLSCLFCNYGKNCSNKNYWMKMINFLDSNQIPDYQKQKRNKRTMKNLI
jgi:hypothetical protein